MRVFTGLALFNQNLVGCKAPSFISIKRQFRRSNDACVGSHLVSAGVPNKWRYNGRFDAYANSHYGETRSDNNGTSPLYAKRGLLSPNWALWRNAVVPYLKGV